MRSEGQTLFFFFAELNLIAFNEKNIENKVLSVKVCLLKKNKYIRDIVTHCNVSEELFLNQKILLDVFELSVLHIKKVALLSEPPVLSLLPPRVTMKYF